LTDHLSITFLLFIHSVTGPFFDLQAAQTSSLYQSPHFFFSTQNTLSSAFFSLFLKIRSKLERARVFSVYLFYFYFATLFFFSRNRIKTFQFVNSQTAANFSNAPKFNVGRDSEQKNAKEEIFCGQNFALSKNAKRYKSALATLNQT